jgi:hypothetical protein
MPMIAELVRTAVPAPIASAARTALAQIPGPESHAVGLLRRRLLELGEDLDGLRFELDLASYRVPYDEDAGAPCSFESILEERARVQQHVADAEATIEMLLAG